MTGRARRQQRKRARRGVEIWWDSMAPSDRRRVTGFHPWLCTTAAGTYAMAKRGQEFETRLERNR
jgi:hypothetical protein